MPRWSTAGLYCTADGTAAWNQAWGGCRLTPLVSTESRRSLPARAVRGEGGARSGMHRLLLLALVPPVCVWQTRCAEGKP
jgi:hypothetical protein